MMIKKGLIAFVCMLLWIPLTYFAGHVWYMSFTSDAGIVTANISGIMMAMVTTAAWIVATFGLLKAYCELTEG